MTVLADADVAGAAGDAGEVCEVVEIPETWWSLETSSADYKIWRLVDLEIDRTIAKLVKLVEHAGEIMKRVELMKLVQLAQSVSPEICYFASCALRKYCGMILVELGKLVGLLTSLKL